MCYSASSAIDDWPRNGKAKKVQTHTHTSVRSFGARTYLKGEVKQAYEIKVDGKRCVHCAPEGVRRAGLDCVDEIVMKMEEFQYFLIKRVRFGLKLFQPEPPTYSRKMWNNSECFFKNIGCYLLFYENWLNSSVMLLNYYFILFIFLIFGNSPYRCDRKVQILIVGSFVTVRSGNFMFQLTINYLNLEHTFGNKRGLLLLLHFP